MFPAGNNLFLSKIIFAYVNSDLGIVID